jgi:hypothetical protein
MENPDVEEEMGYADPHLIDGTRNPPDPAALAAALRPMEVLFRKQAMDAQLQCWVILPATGWGDVGALPNWFGLPVRYADVPYPLLATGR